MAKQDLALAGYVKRDTMLIAVFVAVVVGFLGGIVFSALKTGPTSGPMVAQSPPAGPPAAGQPVQVSPEMAQKMLALEREVAINPGNAGTWAQLGHLYFDTDKPVKAIEAYTKSLELAPGNADVLTDLGVMYRRNGQSEEAIQAFDKAIAANPNHQQSRFNKGVVLRYDLNDREGAIKAWEELIRINPDFRAPNGVVISEAIKEL